MEQRLDDLDNFNRRLIVEFTGAASDSALANQRISRNAS
jgi:hypothetical protein